MNGGPYTVGGLTARAVVTAGRGTPFEDVVRLLEKRRAGTLTVPEGEERVVVADGTGAAFETGGFPLRPERDRHRTRVQGAAAGR
ncbi:hypothetical protein ACH5AO_05905 [Streptomyces sp. NPDC018964]|uniref:hypothetical protein n=1 Tax=unclassified Streptomyces TaxID=2593676 RepID=UPI0037A9CA85